MTDALAFKVSAHVRVLFPPLEQAPDQIASRPLVTLSVMRVPPANAAEPVDPTLTLMPAGLDVTRSPLRPVAETVSVKLPAGGGGGDDDCGVKVRTVDQAPAVPEAFTPRTRHQCCRAANDDAVNCVAVNVCSTTRGVENVLESSTCSR